MLTKRFSAIIDTARITNDVILQSLSTKDENNIDGVEKLLKLSTTVSTTNMHLFDSKCRLHKYESVHEIINDFYYVRYELYGKRKQHLLDLCEKKLIKH